MKKYLVFLIPFIINCAGAGGSFQTPTVSNGSLPSSSPTPTLCSCNSVSNTDSNPEAITHFTSGTLRNDYTGYVGGVFYLAHHNLIVTSLGRMMFSGNSGTHTLAIYSAATGLIVPGSIVLVNMSGATSGQYVYVKLSSGVVLFEDNTYFVVSNEIVSGDKWSDANDNVSITSSFVNVSRGYGNGDLHSWINAGNIGTMYGPVNIKYQLQ